MNLQIKTLQTDVLIIGGGAAGCFNGIKLAENSSLQIIVADKSNIVRSGCLAAGVNALNAYIGKGETPESFLDYVREDSEKVIREDLVYSIAQRLNDVTKKIEALGLPILKDDNGDYVMRGKRSIKINGENIKPILAGALNQFDNIKVLNNLVIIDYLMKDNKVIGAYGLSLKDASVYFINSKMTVCATGGASGIYKPNNPGFSKHKMWYSPFNTGAGYAMGIRAGAEMTTFEMRFIALRCKDTIAPTGTIAQGVNVGQVDRNGNEYVPRYGKGTTPIRLLSTVKENRKGNGPCALNTKSITEVQEKELFKAYLNMAPSQTLKWFDLNESPSKYNVKIAGTEPYIVGGHTGSGYWVDKTRKATLRNLYAIGDVAGGSPKKYVTGCFAEAEIAAESILREIDVIELDKTADEIALELFESVKGRLEYDRDSYIKIQSLEKEMQSVMDEFAGGISTGYEYTLGNLHIAEERLMELMKEAVVMKASNLHELMFIYEIIDRLFVANVLLKHMEARKETRWRGYQENLDFSYKDDENWLKYVNSRYVNGNVEIILRNLVGKDDAYEHQN
ncbi:adenylyl-sulfate reductase subunit alpha [Tepidibacter aestuarii]|uniref:adenylyl-sulfate reductase subunit alpha n=1 Tax=Tepidibacter aestuarii TaxID=2925782 RepID=UPI0020BE451D|nr:adenylyl-sulfate reductase subunit alpha [Tepidibacter aestuarii]CAH2214605.1 Adenylylsulfate reductase alpha-subunit [Tepidibacter aestuarii]